MKINQEHVNHVADDIRGRLETAVENLEVARRTLDDLAYNDDQGIPAEVLVAYLDEYEVVAQLLRSTTHLKALRTNWLTQEILSWSPQDAAA